MANSELIQEFLKNKRFTHRNFRGTVLSTSVTDKSGWMAGSTGDRLYLTVIPYTACLKSIKVGLNVDWDNLEYKVGIAGINLDALDDESISLFTDIKTDLITVAESAATPDVGEMVDIDTLEGPTFESVPMSMQSKTIYQQLCDANGNPIEAFEPYKNANYGVLFFEILAANTNSGDMHVNIEWTEKTPAESPLVIPA